MYFFNVMEENPQNLRYLHFSIGTISFKFSNTSEFYLKVLKICLETLQYNEVQNCYCLLLSVAVIVLECLTEKFCSRRATSVLYNLKYLRYYNLTCLKFSKTTALGIGKIHRKKQAEVLFHTCLIYCNFYKKSFYSVDFKQLQGMNTY